jgi:predicted secreted hydrolase
LLAVYFSSTAQTWKTYPYSPAHSLVTFPKDEGAHPNEAIEWWYTAGHVTGQTTGTHYSFMLTYFHYPQLGFDGFRILNVTNDDKNIFNGESRPCNYPTLSPDSLDIAAAVYNRGTETWTNKKDKDGRAIPFEYSIAASSLTASLKLDMVAQKPPLILADSGFFYQGISSYTYYYSQTSNAVSGVIKMGGITENVTGISWIDRQYGSFNPATGEKYEWFNVQLSNGMDLNVFNIFTSDDRTPSTINYNTLAVYVDSATQYTTDDFKVERLAFEYTSDSVQCYSKKWRLTSALNQIDVTIEAPHPGYEVTLPFRFYEGPTTVTGTVKGKPVTGVGFAELLHSYQKPDVAFTTVPTGASSPLVWQLKNPDGGRVVKYDLDYSTDNQATYLPIASGLTDTSYVWNNKPTVKYWVRLTAYSLDTTLVTYAFLNVNPIVTDFNGSQLLGGYRLFPNPVKDVLTIEVQKPYAKMELSIKDVQGRSFPQKPVLQGSEIQVDVSHLNRGVYFAQIKLDDEASTFKFMVE